MVFKKIAIFGQFPARSGVFSAYLDLSLALDWQHFHVRYIQRIWELNRQSAFRGAEGKTSEKGSGEGPVVRITGPLRTRPVSFRGGGGVYHCLFRNETRLVVVLNRLNYSTTFS